MNAKDFRIHFRNAVAELDGGRAACEDEGVDIGTDPVVFPARSTSSSPWASNPTTGAAR